MSASCKGFLGGWDGKKGIDHPSRVYVRTIVGDGGSLLDVGCGTGIELKGFMLNKIPIRYTGLDTSKERVEWCRKEYPQAEFIEGDLSKIDRLYDTVLIRCVLEHNLEYEWILEKAMRIAGKRIILVLFNYWEGEEDLKLRLKEDGTICGTLSLPKIYKMIGDGGWRVKDTKGPLEHDHLVIVAEKVSGGCIGTKQSRGGSIGGQV